MYRSPEVKMFTVLSLIANALVAVSTGLLALHYMKRGGSADLKLHAAVLALIFSGFFKVQIFMYKLTILEKRLLHLVEPSLQHFKIAGHKDNVDLVIYFVMFWIALVGIAFSLIVPG